MRTLYLALALPLLATSAHAADLAPIPRPQMSSTVFTNPYCHDWKLIWFEHRDCVLGVQSGGTNAPISAPPAVSPPSPPSNPPPSNGCGDGDKRDDKSHDGSKKDGHHK
jgi:hypothetical protein